MLAQTRHVDRGAGADGAANLPPPLPPPLPCVVWGPPGTGKTSVLVEQVLQLLLLHSDASHPHGTSARLLVCAPSNGAADVVLQRLVEHGNSTRFREAMGWGARAAGADGGGAAHDGGGAGHAAHGWVHRLNSSRRSLESFPTQLHRHAHIVDGAFGYMRAAEYADVAVLVSTCVCALDLVACGAVALAPTGVPRGHFTHVLIDEASQGLEPELLIPIVLGRPPALGGCVVVLVGDHKQLGPIVRSAACRRSRHGLDQSLLARLVGMYHADGGRGVEPARPLERVCTMAEQCTMLVRNYRSHAALLEVPSALFYDGALRCAADEADVRALEGWRELRRADGEARPAPLLFYGLVGQQLHELDSPSFFNPTEAAMLVSLVRKLLNGGLGLSTDDIGVIAVYRKQVLKLRRLLRELGLGAVRVGSVDDYQGQEEKVILISTVLSHTHGGGGGSGCGAQTDSLIASPQRFNVAITRAKALLIVVGNPHALAADAHWRALLQFALSRGTYKGVPFSLDEPAPAAEQHDNEDEAEAMLSRLAESALGGARAHGCGASGDELNLSFDLEWRLMV